MTENRGPIEIRSNWSKKKILLKIPKNEQEHSKFIRSIRYVSLAFSPGFNLGKFPHYPGQPRENNSYFGGSCGTPLEKSAEIYQSSIRPFRTSKDQVLWFGPIQAGLN